MSYRPYQEIIRRKSRRVYVGRVPVGDGAPITVQTMTNTLTTDVEGTIAQIRRAELAGVDIPASYGAPRAGDVRDSQADTTAAVRDLGHAPRYSFEEGMRLTLEWYRQHALAVK